MKKRVMSLFMALALCLSMMPTVSYAEEAGAVTKQEAKSGESTADVYIADNNNDSDTTGGDITGSDTTAGSVSGNDVSGNDDSENDVSGNDDSGNDISGNDVSGGDTAVLAMQEENGGHTNHPRCGDVNCSKHGNTLTGWTALWYDEDNGKFMIGEGEDAKEWEKTDGYYALPTGNYYLKTDLKTDATIKNTASEVYLCLNGNSITATGDFDVITVVGNPPAENWYLYLCDCLGGGEITHEGTGLTGRGVSVVDYGSFAMYGGTITRNDAGTNNGGGVYADGSFRMYGGTISNNKAHNGGGVYGSLLVQIYDSFIINNTATYGGGLEYTADFWTLIMQNVTITGNTAEQSGGGAYIYGSKVAMTNVTITDNEAGSKGGGMMLGSNSIWMSGKMEITGNKVGDDANNVYLSNGKQIEVEGALTGSTIGVSMPVIDLHDYVVVAKGSNKYQLTQEDRDAINIDVNDAGYEKMELDNSVAYLNGTPHTHAVCGNADCSEDGHGDEMWKGINDLGEIRGDGNYYLKRSVSYIYGKTYSYNYNVNLCLNGYSITMKGEEDTITISQNRTFTLCDCNGSGEDKGIITHADGKKGSGVKVGVYSSFIMYGGSITGNTASNNGGGVNAGAKESSFIMYGGSITGNAATNNGGGVNVGATSTFTMCGGSITQNSATASGGGVYVGGTMNVNGDAQITDNTVSNVYLPADKTITVDEALNDNAKINVTTEKEIDDGEYVIIADGTENYALTDKDLNAFVSDDTRETINKMLRGNSVAFINGVLHEHTICGKESCAEEGHDAERWKGISTLSEITSAGKYYLTESVELTKTWECKWDVDLCLNGQTITGANNAAVITVASNKSLNITDCRETGTIRHAAEATGGCGIDVQGRLTLWNGTITGNPEKGVQVTGTFYMTGGSIAGNADRGVYVRTNGKFTMSDGTITGNAKGGVYVAASSKFTMTGGSITGNNTASGGAGVYVGASSTAAGTFIVSGKVQITDNWKNGTLENGRYVQGDSGARNNVFLSQKTVYPNNIVTYINIGSDGLSQDARIGVGRTSLPTTAGTGIKIATDAADTSLDYNTIFQVDADGSEYVVSRSNDNLYIMLHSHSWTYSVSEDKATITATCSLSRCPNPDGGSVTIKAPAEAELTYDGNAKTATLEGTFTNKKKNPEISYTMGSEPGNNLAEGSLPTDAGTYTASITVGSVTASVDYTIAKAVPTAGDFDFSLSGGSLIYNGDVRTAEVVAKSGIKGMGAVTAVKYYQGETVVEKPIDAGTYTVKISVAEGANYEAADVTDDTWTFTIVRNENAPIVELKDDTTYIYNGKQITPAVTVKVGGKTLTEGTDYVVIYGDNINAGDGTITIRAQGNYGWSPDEVTHFTIEQAEQELSFAEPELTRNYIDKTCTNMLTQTKGDGTVTYDSNNTAVATVDKDTGEVTLVGAGTATITATATATTNYKEGSTSYTLTVDKALIHLDGAPTARDKVYDGTTDADITVSFADENNNPVYLQRGTDYTVTGTFRSPNASASLQGVDVKVTLSKDCAKKYKLKADTYEAYARINVKTISIESVMAENRSYEKDNTSVTISDVIFKDAVRPLVKGTDYDVTGEMADADAGTDKDVDVTVTLTNDAAGNYSLIYDKYTAKVTISKATAEITAVTMRQIVKNGVAVDISEWASTNNSDDAKLTYELLDSPAGITLDGSMLTAANEDTTAEGFAIRVTAEATTNFTAPAEKIISASVVDKKSVGIIFENIPKDFTVTYGDSDFSMTAGFDTTGTVPGEGDNGAWRWESSNESILEITSGADTATPIIKVKKTGSAILTVTYTSDTYHGSGGVAIVVVAKEVTADMIDAIPEQKYAAEYIKPMPEVKDGTTKLNAGTDFTYSYSDNFNAGIATLTITGEGNYTGTATRKFTISPKSISGATIVLDANSLPYTGSEQTVSINSVMLEGWSDTIVYKIVSGDRATDVTDSITLTISGRDNYTGTASTTWKITKIDPELADFDVTPDLTTALIYDGKEKAVAVTEKTGTRGMGDVTVKYDGSTEVPINAGSYEVTIDVRDGRNYNGRTIVVGTLTINKAATKLEDIKESYKYTLTGEKTVRLADLVEDATGYTIGETEGVKEIISDYSVDAKGMLKYTLTGKGQAGDSVTLPVTITSVNHEDTTVKVIITMKARDNQVDLTITGDNTVVYGKTLMLGTTGGSGTGDVTFRIDKENSTGDATIDGNILTPVKVGSVTVIATKAGDADYNDETSAAFVIMITKAIPTGEPAYTGITTGDRTLADAKLTAGTLKPAEGTLEWVDADGKVLSDDTGVEANKTYTWRFTPADDNYESLIGRIELYHVDLPAISVQPKDASVKAGERAVFEVAATGIDLTYQWQIDRNDGKGFVNLKDATGASYTSGVTDMDCNGFKYRCVISNAAGSVTTETAILTVTVYYTITATAGEHGSISPSGEVEIAEGSSQTFVITADTGYEIESLKVDGAAVEAAASYTFTEVKAAHTIEVTFKHVPYRIISGADSSWTRKASGSLVIRGNGEFSEFQKVLVDGIEVAPENYTATEGSTIITLKAKFLNTLSEGSHTFEIVWRDGSASTHFTVAKNTSGNNNNNSNNNNNGNNSNNNDTGSDNTAVTTVNTPNTGDTSQNALWAVLAAVSFAGFVGMLLLKKKEHL